MLKNKNKNKSVAAIGLGVVIFALYFIFFSARDLSAPSSPVVFPAVSSSSPSFSSSPSSSPKLVPPTTKPNISTSPEQSDIKPKAVLNNINISVPFTPQAPLANWKDQRQEDGCEEAVSLMAMVWVNSKDNETKLTAADWEEKIIALSDFEQEKYGEYRDVTLSDMIDWIFKDYFAYEKVSVKKVASSTDILDELKKGNIVLTPMNGQKLKNPYFTAPGPLTHMILIKGYDYATKEFITNDPGTRRGADYRYPENILFGAISVYPTGSHEEIKKIEKAAIIVERL